MHKGNTSPVVNGATCIIGDYDWTTGGVEDDLGPTLFIYSVRHTFYLVS